MTFFIQSYSRLTLTVNAYHSILVQLVHPTIYRGALVRSHLVHARRVLVAIGTYNWYIIAESFVFVAIGTYNRYIIAESFFL